MLTDLQKRTAQAVVNVFETGRPQGLYGSVTLIPGDTGHLTYGRSQTTLASGNLYLLIKAYCAAPGAQFAPALNPHLARLAARDTSLDTDMAFRGVLHAAGDDPVMCAVQDQFFDRVYWNPSVQDATTAAVNSALGTNVVYDSHIQGAWAIIRNITNTKHGSATQIGEQRLRQRTKELAGKPSQPGLAPDRVQDGCFSTTHQQRNLGLAPSSDRSRHLDHRRCLVRQCANAPLGPRRHGRNAPARDAADAR